MTNTSQRILSWWTLIGLFGVAALLIAVSGYLVYDQQTSAIRNDKLNELNAIADLKCNQIVAWRTERLFDARIHSSGLVRKNFLRFHKSSNDSTLKFLVFARLDSIRQMAEYQNIMIVSPDGRLIISLKPALNVLEPVTKELIDRTVSSRMPVFGDLFRCPVCKNVHLDIAAPIYDEAQHLVAVLVLRTDAERALYPLIQTWPLPSRSAETLLVRREGDNVLFLNILRHNSTPALTIRYPLSRTDVSAIQAVMGKTEKFEGFDYRGIKVLAELRPIPGTSWFMIAKMDSDEILAEARFRGGTILLFVILGIIVSGVMTIFLLNYTQRDIYRRLYHAELENRKSQKEIRAAFYGIGDGVIATDPVGNVRRMNPVAETLTGWTEEEALGQPLTEVFHIVNEESRAKVESPVDFVLREGLVVGLANHTLLISRDGTERPIADSGAPILDEDGNVTGVVLVFRDQTEEREAQKALTLFRSLVDQSNDSIEVLDFETGRFLDINEKGCKDLGYSREESLSLSVFDIDPIIDQSIYSRMKEDIQKSYVFLWEGMHKRKDGTLFPVEVNLKYVKFDREYLISVVRDITERKRAEERVRKLNRVYVVLSNINQAIVRTRDPHELFERVCRIAVEDGGFGMAWVVQPHESTQEVSLAAYAGIDEEDLRDFRFTMKDDSSGWGPSGTALREGRHSIIDDIATDERMAPWSAGALRRGFRSAAAFPLIVSGFVRGVFSLYANESHFFDDEELKLLDELAMDISYAMEFMEKEAERKRAEDALRENEEKYRGLIENSIDVIYSVDAETEEFRYLSPSVEGLLGYTEEDIRQMNGRIRFLTHVLGKEFVPMKKRFELMKSGEEISSGSSEGWWTTKSGEKRYILDHWRVIIKDGKLLGTNGILRDITNRKRAEESLLQSEKSLRQILESLPFGVMIIGKDKKLRFANKITVDLTGFASEEEMKNIICHTFLCSAEVGKCPILDLEERVDKSERVLLTKDGRHIPILKSVVPIVLNGEEVLLESFIDITEKKQAEEMQEKLRTRLLQSQKLEAIGTLAGGIAHDFNNILAAIIGYSELAIPEASEGSQIRSDLSKILQAGNRARDVVNQILTFSRQREEGKTPLNIGPIVKEVMKLLRATLPSTISIVTDIKPETGFVIADPSQIHQVVMNLCTNASHAMREKGGALTVILDEITIDETFVSMNPKASKGIYLQLVVSDTGHGMTKNVMERIFEPYYTTKGPGEGSGLGLSIVHGIIDSIQGTINVYSEPGKGSTFKVYLPVTDQKLPSVHEEKGAEYSGRGRILFVDDESALVEIGVRILKSLGYEVTAMTSSVDALEFFQKNHADIDLVISDMTMPFIPGDELARDILEMRPDMPIIICTGYSDRLSSEEATRMGIRHYIGKPLLKSEIAEKVHQILVKPTEEQDHEDK